MFGISLVMMPIMTNGLNALPSRLNPHGTAINNTVSQVAGSIGTAVLVTIFNSHTKTRAAQIAADLQSQAAASGTTATEEQIAAMTQQVTQQALLDGINYTFLVATGITAVAVILSFFLKRARYAKDDNISTVVKGEKSPAGH
ncbi:Multidrug export protein EmrB [compost metagenome]